MSKTFKVIAKTNDISYEDWLSLRRKGLGGSDCAAAIGMNRYKSALDVWLDKTDKVTKEADNEAMYWGRTMEPVLRNEFAKRTGFTVKESPFMFSSIAYPFMLANVDGCVIEKDGTKALLELKTANGFSAKEWEEGLPPEYFLQVQHYLAVLGLSKAYVAVLIGGNNFRYQAIDRDEDTIQTIIAMEADFWNNYVLKGKEPPIDENSADGLNALYPKSKKSEVSLTAEADEIVAEYLTLKGVEDDLKKNKAICENKLKALLKDNALGITPQGFTVSWKSATRSSLDTTRLKKEKPDIVSAYTSSATYRKFSVTAPKVKADE